MLGGLIGKGENGDADRGDGPLVLLVGHCGFDSSGLKRAVRRAEPMARVERVNSEADLERLGPGASLLMVNRMLDGGFSSSAGLELLRAWSGRGPAVMLVSNFDDAQEEAESAGGVPGVGKRDLGTEEAVGRIRSALSVGGGGGGA